MESFSTIGKKLAMWIFVDEFNDVYKTRTGKVLFVLYCMSGGFFFHEHVQHGFRKFWIIYNIFNCFLVNSFCLLFLFNAPQKDYYAFLCPLPAMSGILAKFGICWWIFLTRDLFAKCIDILHDNDWNEKYVPFCAPYLSKSRIHIIAWLWFVIFIGYMKCDYDSYFKYDSYVNKYYPMYFPYPDENTPLQYAVRFVQIVTFFPEVLIFLSFPTFAYVMVAKTYTKFELLSLYLRETSYSVCRCIDEVHNMETAIHEKRIPSSLTTIRELKIQKALSLDELKRKIIIVIERHQKYHSLAKSYVKNLEYFYLAIYEHVFLASVIHTFIFTSITETGQFQSFSQFSLLVICGFLMCWLIACFAAQMFLEVNGIIAEEIYCSPWYHLEPKDRKLVHIFLTILQRPIAISIGGSNLVDLSSFPDTLNTMYSQIQILRTLQHNKQIHRNY